MREAVLLGSYSNTIEKEVTLIETILDWKKYNIPIILSTHFPESERVQNLVDYYIFDKNQHLDPALMNRHHYWCSSFKIIANFDRPYHAAAGLISLQNALRTISNKFDFIYLQDYDVQLNKEKTLNICRNLYSSEFEIFMMNWYADQNKYATNVCFFKQGGFNKIWGDIQSVQDYLDLVELVGTSNNLIEDLAKNLIEVKNLKSSLYLFNEDQQKQLITNFSKHKSDENHLKIYLSSTSDNSAILFIINEASVPQTFKIRTTNLWQKDQHEEIHTINGNIGMFWRIFNTETKLEIFYNNNKNKKDYYIVPCNNFRECIFEFTDGTNIHMKE